MKQLPGVRTVEQWPSGLIYLELDNQPKYNAKPSTHFNAFIKFFDPSVDPND